MTHQEYIQAQFNLEQEAREQKRANAVQLQLLDAKHRENVQAEMDRHMTAVRRQKAEYAEKCDSILRRMNEIKKQRAASRAEEEKAAAAIGYPVFNPADNSGCPTEAMS